MDFYLDTRYSTTTCCYEKCGMTFAVPISWNKDRIRDQKNFCCPNGHWQSYTGETSEQKLRKQIKHIESENERCMLNLKRKNQDLVIYRMADSEELFIKKDHTTIHIKKSNGSSEISFLCGYKASVPTFSKIDTIQEEHYLCGRCVKAMKAKNLRGRNDS